MLIRHIASYGAARGLPAVVVFATLMVYTRMLSPEEYGMYSVVLAATLLGQAVFFQWLRLSVTRFLPCSGVEHPALLSSVACGFLLVTTAVTAGAGVIYLIAPVEWASYIAVGALILAVQGAFEICLELARSRLQPMRYGTMSVLKTLSALALGGLFIKLGYGAMGALLGLALGLAMTTVWCISVDQGLLRFRWVQRSTLQEIGTYGLPLTATFALGFIVSTSDRLLLGWLIGPDAAGLYSVGYDLARNSLGMLMMIVTLAAYPLAVRALEERGPGAAIAQCRTNVTALLTLALPAAAGLIVLAPNLAATILGNGFHSAASAIVPVIAVVSLLEGLKVYYFDHAFHLSRATGGQLVVAATAASLNVGLNLLWIPRFGVDGAAFASMVAFSVALVMSWRMGARVFRLPFPVKDSCKIAVAAGVMALGISPTAHHSGGFALLAQVALGTLIYSILLLIMNVAGVRDTLTARVRRWSPVVDVANADVMEEPRCGIGSVSAARKEVPVNA